MIVEILFILLHILGLASCIYNATNSFRRENYGWFSIHCTMLIIIILGIVSTII